VKSSVLSPTIETNRWVHLAIIIDIPSKSMVTYIDGKPISKNADIPSELTSIFGLKATEETMLNIGKSLSPGDPYLNAMIHDLRIYRVPLSNQQVIGIYKNSVKGVQNVSVNVGKPEDDLPKFAPDKAELY
ncbi:hypothetical protein GQM99_25585, partial [Escherichia coli]|uniref:LamG domain-containing protein n=1 Tax=Escherichia coli TaxID=562 RepID=UPI001365B58B